MCLRGACKSACGAGEDEPAHTSSPAPHHSATSSRAVHEYVLPSHALRPSPPTPPAQSGPAARSESPASWHPEPAPSTATLRRQRRPPPRWQATLAQTPRAGGRSRKRRAQAGPRPGPPRPGSASPKGHQDLFFFGMRRENANKAERGGERSCTGWQARDARPGCCSARDGAEKVQGSTPPGLAEDAAG